MREPTLTKDAFACLLAAEEPERSATVTSLQLLTGGYSRLTAVAEVAWDDSSTERFLLRADPPPCSGVFVSDRDAEHELLQALADVDSVPTARPRWYDSTGEHFGTKCLVVEHFPGRSLQHVLAETGGAPDLVRLHVDTMAAVHDVPLDVLPDSMVQPADWDSYVDGVLDGYAQVERALSDSSPVVRHVSARLRAARPEPAPFTLVHGDCQPSNLLVAASGEHLLIDWEFARIGDPREDLGYYTQVPALPHTYHQDPVAFLERYRELTGLSATQVDRETVDWFLVLGIARLYTQIVQALDDVSRGGSHGVMATYLVNAVTHLNGLFFRVARGLDR